MDDVQRKVILTIDDEEYVRNSIRNFLEDLNYTVLEGVNGKDGWDLFQSKQPDLVLVDLRMPEMDGLEVLSRIQKSAPDTPVIVISGTGMIADVVEALRKGAWDYLLKPLEDISVLEHAVVKALERKRLLEENRLHKQFLEDAVKQRTQQLEKKTKAYRESKRNLQSFFDALIDFIFVLDMDLDILAANPVVYERLGYTEDKLLSLSLPDIFPLNRRDEVLAVVHEVLEGRQAKCTSNLATRHDQEIPVEIKILQGVWRSEPALFVISRDITERIQVEQAQKLLNQSLEDRVARRTIELENANQELHKAKQLADDAALVKSEFLANMSYDLQTPMNVIINATDLILNKELPANVAHEVSLIQHSGQNVLEIINDILDFSKMEAGRLLLEQSPIQMQEILDNVTTACSTFAKEKKLEVLLDVEPGTPMVLRGDQLRIQRVLSNLLSNAIKFSEQSGVIIVGVSIDKGKSEAQEVLLHFFIKDNGVGIDEKDQENLFQPFTRSASKPMRPCGETGLGLSICKQLVELMQGKIWVESEKGCGTTFHFTLKLLRQSSAYEKSYTVPEDLRSLNVLVIDDSAESRTLLQKVLQSFGFTVGVASSGEEALELLNSPEDEERIYDLIIMDWLMPSMSGTEACKHIREDLKLELPIIMLSAVGCESELEQDDIARINGFLNKPFNASSLFDSIMDVFGKVKSKRWKEEKGIVTNASVYRKRVRGLHILLAEDNPSNQEVARAILERAGVLVQIANNGKEALEAVQYHFFDAVLMDINMPQMDGYEATEIIRKNPEFDSMPIIAYSAIAYRSGGSVLHHSFLAAASQ